MDSYARAREIEKPKPHVIWKFDLPLRGAVTFQIPRGAVVLSVGVQRRASVEVPVVWVCCRPDAPLVARKMSIRVTGGTVPSDDGGLFVGTFQIHEGEYVGHVFDMGEKS